MSAGATFIRRRWPIVATLLTLLIVALPTGAAVWVLNGVADARPV